MHFSRTICKESSGVQRLLKHNSFTMKKKAEFSPETQLLAYNPLQQQNQGQTFRSFGKHVTLIAIPVTGASIFEFV
jgi:hypothetical protein